MNSKESVAPLWPSLSRLTEGTGVTMPDLEQRPAPYPPNVLRAKAVAYADNDPWVAQLLEDLASTPRALKPFNRPDDERRNFNIALHVLAVTKYAPPKQHKPVRGRVAVAWGISDKHVQDILTPHRAAAATWLTNLIEYIGRRSDWATEAEILAAIDADLTLRAAQMGRGDLSQ